MLLKIGDVDADAEFNRKISPLFHVDNIKAPLLIGQGANDPRVKQAEADQIAFSMHAKQARCLPPPDPPPDPPSLVTHLLFLPETDSQIPVEYVLYPDEGHGFQRPANRIDFNGRTEEFLAEHLGGRAEEFKSPEGSTALFPLKTAVYEYAAAQESY